MLHDLLGSSQPVRHLIDLTRPWFCRHQRKVSCEELYFAFESDKNDECLNNHFCETDDRVQLNIQSKNTLDRCKPHILNSHAFPWQIRLLWSTDLNHLNPVDLMELQQI